MDVNAISATERTILRQALQAFREHDAEIARDFECNAIEAKLKSGEGVLNEKDVHVLGMAIAGHVTSEEAFVRLTKILGLS